MSALTDPIDPAQQLETSPIVARCVMRPSLPTMRLMRSSSRAIFPLVAFNEVIATNGKIARELDRISRTVGKEGRITQRATIGDVSNRWAGTTAPANAII